MNKTPVKHDIGKPKMTLVPPRAMMLIAKAMTFGEIKYKSENYLEGDGFEWRRLMNSCMRHCYKWLIGIDNDEESGLPHIAHAACCLMMLLESIETNSGKDDRWVKNKENKKPITKNKKVKNTNKQKHKVKTKTRSPYDKTGLILDQSP